MKKKIFKYISLVKNWPGGRRNAVIVAEGIPTWNKQVQDFTNYPRSYITSSTYIKPENNE